ncbi:MAG: BON domain-containing protein [Solirubrobacterales bacterium]|nr:BON domain-containing protein [Solirubrobacterales bacterium]
MRGSAAIERDIRSALERDSRIPHPLEIAVSVDEIGAVILRGTVADLRQRHAAVGDARAVDCLFQSRVAEEAVAHLAGIDGISNQLRVALPG